MNRRHFLKGVSGALALAACGSPRGTLRIEHAEKTGELRANMYVTVLPNGRVQLIVNKAEIGQGVATGWATLCAEEIGVPLAHVDTLLAGSDERMRGASGMQLTGGSTSTAEAYLQIRKASATAREMLVAAAAKQWQVDPKDCRVADGHVLHGERKLPYGELTRAAARLPVPDAVLKSPKEFTLVGKTNQRVDLQAKLDGTAIYGIDVRVPDMVNAYAIHGPTFGAKPTSVIAEAARKRPGVIDVLTFDWGVAIVADKFWQARAAAADVAINWDHGHVNGLDTTKLRAAMRAFDGDGQVAKEHGDIGGALASATTKVGGTYEAPYLAHAPMEPNNATAHVVGGKAEIWAPSQSPTVAQAFVANALGIDMRDVTVHVTLAGGGFGRRAIADACAQAAQISHAVKRPVKLTWTRESDMTQAWYRPIYAGKFEAALHDGKVTGVRAHVLSQSIAVSGKKLFGAALSKLPGPLVDMIANAAISIFETNSFGDIFATEGMTNTPYRFGSYEVRTDPVQTKLPVSFWRSVGNSVTGFIMEGLMDELAVAAKQDPFALRRSLLEGQKKQLGVLDRLEQLSGWRTLPRGKGMARHFAFDTEVGEVVQIEMVGDRIRVKKVWCVVDCGIAVNPDIVKAQMEGAIIFGLSAALDQEITLVDGVVQQKNFDTFPLLRMHECPEIVVEIMASEEKPTGVGEPGLPPIAPAVAAAVHDLTGVRLRKMPLHKAWKERA